MPAILTVVASMPAPALWNLNREQGSLLQLVGKHNGWGISPSFQSALGNKTRESPDFWPMTALARLLHHINQAIKVRAT